MIRTLACYPFPLKHDPAPVIPSWLLSSLVPVAMPGVVDYGVTRIDHCAELVVEDVTTGKAENRSFSSCS
jgi:hypothetical protein